MHLYLQSKNYNASNLSQHLHVHQLMVYPKLQCAAHVNKNACDANHAMQAQKLYNKTIAIPEETAPMTYMPRPKTPTLK